VFASKIEFFAILIDFDRQRTGEAPSRVSLSEKPHNMKILGLLSVIATVSSFCPQPKPLRAVILQKANKQVDPDWVEQDMKDTGLAEKENEDWVAQRMV
jgi:hypothetical protein